MPRPRSSPPATDLPAPSVVPRWTAISVAWWTLYGLVGAAQYHAMRAMDGSPVSWAHAMVPTLASALLWIPFTVMALALAERRPLGAPWRRSLPPHLAATVVAVLGRALAVVVFDRWVHWYAELPSFGSILVTSVLNNVLLYWMVTAAAHAVVLARDARRRERQLVEARLQALTGQVHPHFLFNTLHTLSMLVHEDARAADRVLVRLGELLRASLDGAVGVEAPLRDELRLVAAYLEIEQARFEDRLRVTWSVDPEAYDALVPRFILQPLVENAIRHGVGPRPVPGTVEIGAAVADGALRLVVRDDGVGWPRGPVREGVGLSSTRARLAGLHPERHAVVVVPAPGGGTEVVLELPFRRAARAAEQGGPVSTTADRPAAAPA